MDRLVQSLGITGLSKSQALAAVSASCGWCRRRTVPFRMFRVEAAAGRDDRSWGRVGEHVDLEPGALEATEGPGMQLRPLGRTGVSVNQLCLGT